METGHQIYQGLAGLFIVSDDEEQWAGLPSGEQDLAIVMQDRTFDGDNQLVYATGNPMEGAMDYLMGFLGERVLVNDKADASIAVATRAYRLRLLNYPSFLYTGGLCMLLRVNARTPETLL